MHSERINWLAAYLEIKYGIFSMAHGSQAIAFQILFDLALDQRDHVYLRHLSTEYRSILSADMSAESRPIYRPILGRYVGRVSVDMLFELIDCWSTLSIDMSVDTWPTPRSICCDRQSLVYRSTVGDVSVDYRWYRSIDN